MNKGAVRELEQRLEIVAGYFMRHSWHEGVDLGRGLAALTERECQYYGGIGAQALVALGLTKPSPPSAEPRDTRSYADLTK